jgi:hypothetical protein
MWCTVPAPWIAGSSGASSHCSWPAPLPAGGDPAGRVGSVLALHAEHLEQRLGPRRLAGVGPDAVKAGDRVLGGDAVGGRDERRVRDVVGEDERQAEALGVGEAQGAVAARGVDAVVAEAALPEVERLRRADPPADGVDHARAGTAADRARGTRRRS